MKLWVNESSLLDLNEIQEIKTTAKSLVVDAGKDERYYRLEDVSELVDTYKQDNDLQSFLYGLQSYAPYKTIQIRW